jgi:hypothetical protein
MRQQTIMLGIIILLLLHWAGCAATKGTVQSTSVDVGAQYDGYAAYPYLGATIPVGPVNFSGGVWGDLKDIRGTYGPYFTLNYSWLPFENLFTEDTKTKPVEPSVAPQVGKHGL